MSRLSLWVCVAAAFAVGAVCRAETPCNQLAGEGTWAKYHTVVEAADNELVLEVVLRSVGQATADGRACRWIEIQTEDLNEHQRLEVYKLLLPEDRLQNGPAAVTDAVRGWILPRDNDVPHVASEDELSVLKAVFPGPLAGARRLDDKELVDWQQGQLECEVWHGERSSTLGDQTTQVVHELFLHPQAPFGLGGFRTEMEFQPSGARLTVEGRLTDAGTDAQSVLPNAQ